MAIMNVEKNMAAITAMCIVIPSVSPMVAISRSGKLIAAIIRNRQLPALMQKKVFLTSFKPLIITFDFSGV